MQSVAPSSVSQRALVVDDQPTTLRSVCETLRLKGYDVDGALSIREAKRLVTGTQAPYDLIVSDYDFGRNLLEKYRMFDGYRFLTWCHARGLTAKLVLHSTVFESHQRFGRWFHESITRVSPKARARGITVQAKSILGPRAIKKQTQDSGPIKNSPLIGSVIWFASKLPHRLMLNLGYAVGLCGYFLSRKYRRAGYTNLQIAFKGALSDEDCKQIVRGAFCQFGRSVFEFIWGCGQSRDEILKKTKLIFSGPVKGLFDQSNGVLACSTHLGNWMWPALYFAAYGAPVYVVVRELDVGIFNRGMHTLFSNAGIVVIGRPDATVDGSAALKKGAILGLMIDQNASIGGMLVPFLGVMASTMRGPAVLRKHTGASLLCVHEELREGIHHIFVGEPQFSESDEFAELIAINNYFEPIIKRNRDMYFWLHRRWKTQPAGGPAYYDEGSLEP